MSTLLKTGLILSGIATTLLIIFAVPRLLNGNRFRAEAIAYLEESTGKKIEIDQLTVTFLPKVTVHMGGFGVKSPPLFPPSYILKVARIDAEVDPWALLHRQIVVRAVILKEPIINLVSDPDGPWNFENPAAKNKPNSFRMGAIALVKIEGGRVIASNLLPSDAAGPVFFEAHGVSSELKNVNLGGIADPAAVTLDGQGRLEAQLLRFGSIEAKTFSSNIQLQARQISFTDIKAKSYGGDTSGEFSIKLSGKTPSFKADVRMHRIDVASLLSAFKSARGKMTGKMDGRLKITGEIEHSMRPLAGLHGSGHLTVRDGQVPSLKLNANLMKLAHYNDLGPAKNDPSSFNFVSTDLELDQERISSKVIDIDGYGVDVDGSGSVSLSGSDQLDYQGVAEIVSRQGFVTNLFARLAGATLKNGKLTFPFRVTGTIDHPAFAK